ncbi:MAG: ATP-dependent helicase RecG [Patescibacteria group bacterium]|nr:ATP-dependent helicase RecG [Patescibacteria group bacterium]
MYHLTSPLSRVTGIGPVLSETLKNAGCETVLDLLLQLPLRYEDRSQFFAIADPPQDVLFTTKAKVIKLNTYYKNRRPITNARIADDTGSLTIMWFNNSFVKQTLKVGEEYLFSGKINDRKTMVQPAFERAVGDSIHTNRLVPLYSSIMKMKQGSLRRILKNITDQLSQNDDAVVEAIDSNKVMPLSRALTELHFPSEEENVVDARERLALEELLSLIAHSNKLKAKWEKQTGALSIHVSAPEIPTTIPFELTGAQVRCISEILSDIQKKTPMNRILIGDVGSGKTVVAGTACWHVIKSGYNAALVAPTQILATQHAATFAKMFPDIPVSILSGKEKSLKLEGPQLVIGTHAVINKIDKIKPALIIYDEQHRFGVKQRSEAQQIKPFPHVLTMTATPIPRTMLLTIFSHLAVSVIDELPKNRIPTKTWVLPENKRADMYDWIVGQLKEQGKGNFQTLLICPFIDPSNSQALENIASTKERYESVKKYFGTKARVGLLHGRQSQKEKKEIIESLFDKKIDVLVTTPIVEVGIDLPQASAIIIESSERFGLASLHQLRGRVGRAGQQGYCMLFSSSKSAVAKKRLQAFSEITKGQQLAELDLQNRGAGDIFGVEQSGFGELRFATWTNFELISLAQSVLPKLDKNWQPIFNFVSTDDGPLAN